MDQWTLESIGLAIYAFDELAISQKELLILYCNEHFPPSVFNRHLDCRKRAMDNAKHLKDALDGVVQKFPPMFDCNPANINLDDLDDVAIILTAGGDGERLKRSLIDKGVSELELKDFTKATYPLPDFFSDFGALHANLCLVAALSKQHNVDIPVVITTGPAGSTTARVIPEIIVKHDNFGLKHIEIVEQEERLHFTMDNKMAYKFSGDDIRPVTHPDETGGPLMSLKRGKNGKQSILSQLEGLGCAKMIVLQATGMYEPYVLFAMASALKYYDCIGAGILRETFTERDPFGTYVSIVNNTAEKVIIVEQEIRNRTTMSIKDDTDRYYLPYNTGLYAFKKDMLAGADLPDYATPPKEILQNLHKSPKIGYAATDIFSLSGKTAVLSVPPASFAVIKNSNDLQALSDLGKRTGIIEMCRKVSFESSRFRK